MPIYCWTEEIADKKKKCLATCLVLKILKVNMSCNANLNIVERVAYYETSRKCKMAIKRRNTK